MMKRLISAAVLLFLPVTLFAADGDSVSGSLRSGLQISTMRYLCDSKTSADEGNDCADMTFVKIPSFYIFTVNESAGCSAWSVTIKTKAISTGDSHDLATMTSASESTMVVSVPLSQVVFATLNTLTNCTDFDVTVEAVSPER